VLCIYYDPELHLILIFGVYIYTLYCEKCGEIKQFVHFENRFDGMVS